jgi:hypothetical protein
MNEKDIFILADNTLNKVVQQIRDDQWDMVMPANFATRAKQSSTLREIINYHAYDDIWVPDMLAGKTMEEAGKGKFDGDLLEDTPKKNFAKIVEVACLAVRDLDDLDSVVHCSFGDYGAREYLWQINSFRGFRAHDIAKVIGVDSTLPDELVQGLWEELSPNVEEWRKIGVFGPEVVVPEGASMQDKLLGMVGREP